MGSIHRLFKTVLNQITSKHVSQSQSSLTLSLISSSNVTNTKRSYNTATKHVKETLFSKISPLGNPKISIKPELDNWVDNGNKIRFAELIRIIHDFRKRKRYTHALEVMEWMFDKGICRFTPIEHAVKLDLIGRVRGFISAETYFNCLPDEDRNDKTYGALLNCYVRQRQVEKSLAHFQKMKELGFASTTLTFNDIMCLYTNVGQYDKVPDVLAEMKKNNVLPDNYSYRLCINAYGARPNLEAVDAALKEAETQPHMAVDWNTYAVAANFYIKAGLTYKALDALKKAEIRLDKKDGTGYNHLISLYTKLGEKGEILRLWEKEKSTCKKCLNRDYINILESLVRIAAPEKAEEVLREWESSDNFYDYRVPNIVIVGYLNLGNAEKAAAMLQEVLDKGRVSSPKTWSMLARWYMDKNEMREAVRCMKVGLSFYEANKGWRPNDQVITSIVSWIGDHGSLENADSFIEVLGNVSPINRPMYDAFIKTYVRNGKDVDDLLKKMKTHKVRQDGEATETPDRTPEKA